jgi:hypothetical protein
MATTNSVKLCTFNVKLCTFNMYHHEIHLDYDLVSSSSPAVQPAASKLLAMSFREKLFIDKLYWQAKKTLYHVLSKRRQTFWGETPVVLRTRKYKYAGAVRSEWVRSQSTVVSSQAAVSTVTDTMHLNVHATISDGQLLSSPSFTRLSSSVSSSSKWLRLRLLHRC